MNLFPVSYDIMLVCIFIYYNHIISFLMLFIAYNCIGLGYFFT